MNIRIENISDIKAAFNKSPVLMMQELGKAIKRSILVIQGESMRNTPIDTGRLRASHTTLFGELKAELTPTADYAIFVHDGTKYMKSRPFLFDAVKSKEQFVQDEFKDSVQRVLDKTGDDI